LIPFFTPTQRLRYLWLSCLQGRFTIAGGMNE
jgi:hypothetical protein